MGISALTLIIIMRTIAVRAQNKEFLNQQLNVIDEFINFRTTLIFSAILLIFVISYDLLLSLILIMNCILNYFVTTKIKSYTSSKEKKSELDLNSYFLNKVKNDYEIISYINLLLIHSVCFVL